MSRLSRGVKVTQMMRDSGKLSTNAKNNAAKSSGCSTATGWTQTKSAIITVVHVQELELSEEQMEKETANALEMLKNTVVSLQGENSRKKCSVD